MRLLHKKTLEFKWFPSVPPPYIVLSHRWLGLETSLQEFIQQHKQDEDAQSDGVRKVLTFCSEMMSHTEDYVWIDTCCIDKTSSTELQEAINSMYKWYENAALCVVFLDDVNGCDNRLKLSKRLSKSLWFTRGWTLQELIAPKNLLFLGKGWKSLGTRGDFAETIEQVTHVPARCLGNAEAVHDVPVAERMMWLSRRQTTRQEDLAYCMLGIFDVNMPMLYGEGKKAFFRLQKELLQVTDDESIFLWTTPVENGDVAEGWEGCSAILAPAPACFTSVLDRKLEIDDWFDRAPPRMTAKGLEMEIWDQRSAQFTRSLVAPLNVLVNGQRACLELLNMSYLKDPKKADNKRWTRTGLSQMITIGKDEREPPPTARQAFESELEDARRERQGQQRMAVHSNMVSGMNDQFGPFTQRNMREAFRDPGSRPERGSNLYSQFYRTELTRFKVFVK